MLYSSSKQNPKNVQTYPQVKWVPYKNWKPAKCATYYPRKYQLIFSEETMLIPNKSHPLALSLPKNFKKTELSTSE